VADRGGLENRLALTRHQGSNPCLSADSFIKNLPTRGSPARTRGAYTQKQNRDDQETFDELPSLCTNYMILKVRVQSGLKIIAADVCSSKLLLNCITLREGLI
jgi:hypothetical protein